MVLPVLGGPERLDYHRRRRKKPGNCSHSTIQRASRIVQQNTPALHTPSGIAAPQMLRRMLLAWSL